MVSINRLQQIAPDLTLEQLVLILWEFGILIDIRAEPIERPCPFLQDAWVRMAEYGREKR